MLLNLSYHHEGPKKGAIKALRLNSMDLITNTYWFSLMRRIAYHSSRPFSRALFKNTGSA